MFRRYFWTALLASQVIALAGCAPAQPNTANVQNTAIALSQTALHIDTPTATYVSPTPSPLPTQPPPPILTPDSIQVERWKEYQTELIRGELSGYDPALYKYALCEWDILGRSGQEVYAWAYCAIPRWGDGRLPAVIHLEADGSVQNVEVPEINNSTWDSQILRMFPAEVREKFGLYTGDSLFFGRLKEMMNHINYRETHPGEPPLVILSAIPTATRTP